MKKLKYEILFTILFMFVGMAAVTSNLVINGNTNIASNPEDFLVYFSNVKVNGIQDLSLVQSDTSLVFNKELSAVNQSVVISYDITNTSKNYDADVNITCTQSTDYLNISNFFDTTNTLGARQTQTGTLTITQTKSYTGTELTQEISCTITASAVERTTQSTEEVPGAVEPSYYPMLMSTSPSDTSTFRAEEYRSRITEVIFEDEINIPTEAIASWDISTTQDGSIIAYVIDNEDQYYDNDWTDYYDAYDLVIQANGKMYANPDMSYWFQNFYVLRELDGLENLDTISTRNMSYMFALSTITDPFRGITLDLRVLNTSNVTNMSHMFYGQASNVWNIGINMSGMDVSSVIDMSYMFAGCSSYDGDVTIDVSNMDANYVSDMSYTFSSIRTDSGNIKISLTDINAPNIKTIKGMFSQTGSAISLTLLNLQGFDTSNVTDMSYMFYAFGGSYGSTTLYATSFNTTNVTNMSHMFSYVDSGALQILDVLKESDTSSVTDMSYMFEGIASYENYNEVTTIDLRHLETNSVTNMEGMFKNIGISEYEGISLSDKYNIYIDTLDTSNVTNIYQMFAFSQKIHATITISNPYISNYDNIFNNTNSVDSLIDNGEIIVNYTNATEELVDSIIVNYAGVSNISKGTLVD